MSLEPYDEAAFKSDAEAWAFFQAQPPSYRHAAIYCVLTAKRPETRARRLATLIADRQPGGGSSNFPMIL